MASEYFLKRSAFSDIVQNPCTLYNNRRIVVVPTAWYQNLWEIKVRRIERPRDVIFGRSVEWKHRFCFGATVGPSETLGTTFACGAVRW